MKEYIVSQEYIDGIYTDEGSTFGLDMQKELIRCKDCKWYSANTGYHWGRCENYRPFPFDETDYCSRAERKGE